jgi:hypothetical protein
MKKKGKESEQREERSCYIQIFRNNNLIWNMYKGCLISLQCFIESAKSRNSFRVTNRQ